MLSASPLSSAPLAASPDSGIAYAIGVSATGLAGGVTVLEGTGVTVNVTGLFASGVAGSVAVQCSANVSVEGVAAFGRVGQVLVWGPIRPDQNPSWAGISPVQNPSWTPIAA